MSEGLRRPGDAILVPVLEANRALSAVEVKLGFCSSCLLFGRPNPKNLFVKCAFHQLLLELKLYCDAVQLIGQALPSQERMRRQHLLNELYYVKVLVNGSPLARTPPRPLGASFHVAFNELFSVHLNRAPTSLVLQLWHAVSAIQRDTLLSGLLSVTLCVCACCV